MICPRDTFSNSSELLHTSASHELGPGDQVCSTAAADTLRILNASLMLQHRQTLERLAVTQPVHRVLNCQYCIAHILAWATTLDDPIMNAFGSPLFTGQEMNTPLQRANNLE